MSIKPFPFRRLHRSRAVILTALSLTYGCETKSKESQAKSAAAPAAAHDADPNTAAPAGDDGETLPVATATPMLLTDIALDCDVLNAADRNATHTTFGCSVKDRKGALVTAKLEALGAKVASSAGADVDAPVSSQPAGASYQFAIDAACVPATAQSLTMSIVVDGTKVSLLFLVPANYLSATSGPLHFYVDGATGKDDGTCEAANPCLTIQRAVDFVPTQIAHDVVISVAGGKSYGESVLIEGRSITRGTMTLEGVPGAGGEAVTVTDVHPLTVRNIQASPSQLIVSGLEFDVTPEAAGKGAAVLVDSAKLSFGSLRVRGRESVEAALATLDLGKDAAKYDEGQKTGGYGVVVQGDSSVRVSGLDVKGFGTCLVISNAGLSVIGGAVVETCLQGVELNGKGSLVFAAGPAAADPFVVRDVLHGIHLNDGSSAARGPSSSQTRLEVVATTRAVQGVGRGLYAQNGSAINLVGSAGSDDFSLQVSGFPDSVIATASASLFTSGLSGIRLDGAATTVISASEASVHLSAMDVTLANPQDAPGASPLVSITLLSSLEVEFSGTLSLMPRTSAPNALPASAFYVGEQSIVRILNNSAAIFAEPAQKVLALLPGAAFFVYYQGARRGMTSASGMQCNTLTWFASSDAKCVGTD